MKLKKMLTIGATGLIAGFIIGTIWGLYDIAANRYLSYKLQLIALYTIQRELNTWVVIMAAVFIILAITAYLGGFVVRFAAAKDLSPRFLAALKAVLVASILCACSIYLIHHFWWYFVMPQHNPKIFLFDGAAVLITATLGWVLYKINWSVFFAARIKLFAIAFVLLLKLGILNIGIFIYEAFCIPKRPDIILISIDTLRADHLGCYGYHRNTSPNMDNFAKEGVLFKRAYAQEPWTLPSHMSMLTGLYPLTHGVRDDTTTNLPSAVTTLAEILKNHGYATAGFVNGGLWMHPEWGFKQGFDYYNLSDNYSPELPERNAQYQNLFIKKYLQHHKKKNNFLFIHYFDVHSDTVYLPYDAPPPFDTLFSSNFDQVDFGRNTKGAVASEYLAHINKHNIILSPKELDYIIALYDNGIAYTDKCIGDLLDMLKSFELYHNALIIITSDHGEAFQEHGYMVHGTPYYHEEQMHVPLLLKLPDRASHPQGLHIESMVELIDIMPSILHYLGIFSPFVQGSSFLALLEGKPGKEYVYGLSYQSGLFIRSERWKIIGDQGLNTQRFQLFDIMADPREQHNLLEEKPDIKNTLYLALIEKFHECRTLKSQLSSRDSLGTNILFEKGFSVDEAQKERLKSLGYLQ